MKELIKINPAPINSQTVNTVNARDLHQFLEIGKVFGAWINERISQFEFIENQDFVCFPDPESKGREGHNHKEYHLTLNMAKELSMVERNEKGKQARQYFIECESIAKQAPITDPMTILNDPASMRTLLLTYTEKVIDQETEIKELTPKAEALDRISTADGSYCVTDAAKVLQIRPKDLFGYMSMNGWIYRRTGGSHWVAYQNRIQQGVMTHKVTTISRSDGSERTIEQALVTPKGLSRLALEFDVKIEAAA